jgi:hypothetical protein
LKEKNTALGVKLIGLVQWNFKAYYLYGELPHKQEKVFGESSHIFLGMCFQMFLDKQREKYPAHLNVIQLENGKFHQSSRLKIPDNILLIFQPPYSPKLNPIERIWSHIKEVSSHRLFSITRHQSRVVTGKR